jgi:hypothetical protein
MQIICPFCGYRTERDVAASEVIPCPWCERPYQPGSGPGEESSLTASAVLMMGTISAAPPQPARRRWTKLSAALVVFWIGMLFLPVWSRWQQARNRASSPPGRVLIAQGQVLKVVFSRDGQRLASSGGIYQGRGKWPKRRDHRLGS